MDTESFIKVCALMILGQVLIYSLITHYFKTKGKYHFVEADIKAHAEGRCIRDEAVRMHEKPSGIKTKTNKE